MDLLEYLRRRGRTFWARVSGGNERDRRFTALAKDLARYGPSWYDPWSDQIKVPFAQAIDKLRALCDRPGALLSRLDDRLANLRTQEWLLDRGLAKRGLSLSSLTFDALREEAKKKGSKSIEEMDSSFSGKIAAFESAELLDLAQGFSRCERLLALCQFDFKDLLDAFRRGGAGFRATRGSEVAAELDDLRYLLDGLECDEKMAETLSLIDEMQTGGRAGQEKLRAAVAEISDLATKQLSPAGLGLVVRAAYLDTERELRVWQNRPDIRKPLVDRLLAEYGEERRAWKEKRAAAEVEARKKALFGDEELFAVEAYDDVRNAFFVKYNLPPFQRVIPLRIVKTFMKIRYAPLVRQPVTDLIICLVCESADFEGSLGSSFEACNAISRRLLDFEEALISPSRSRLPDAIKGLKAGTLDAGGRRSAAKAIAETDRKADEIIQSCLSACGELNGCLVQFLADIRSPHPALVANARTINESHSKVVVALTRSAVALQVFLKLLRAFVVDVEEARAALKTG